MKRIPHKLVLAITFVFLIHHSGESSGTDKKVNAQLISGEHVSFTANNLLLSPSGDTLLFTTGDIAGGIPNRDLFAVDGKGETSPVKLNNSPAPESGVAGFSGTVAFNNPETLVAFQPGPNLNGQPVPFGHYVVPLNNPTPVAIGGAKHPNSQLASAKFTPDSSRLVYLADPGNMESAAGLFSRLVDVSQSAVRLDSQMGNGAGVFSGFELTQDGSTVLYATAEDPRRIYTNSVEGGTPVLVATAGNEDTTSSFSLNHTGDRLVYVDFDSNTSQRDLVSVRLDGTDSKVLNVGQSVLSYKLSDSSDYLAYIARNEFGIDLYIVSSQGGLPIKVNPANTALLTFDIDNVIFSKSGNYVSFEAFDADTFAKVMYSYELGEAASTTFAISDVYSQIGVVQQTSSDRLIVKARVNTFPSRTVFLLLDTASPNERVFELDGLSVFFDEFFESTFGINADESMIVFVASARVYALETETGRITQVGRSPVLEDGFVFSNIQTILVNKQKNSVFYIGDMETIGKWELYAIDLDAVSFEEEELCIPISMKNSKVTVICL